MDNLLESQGTIDWQDTVDEYLKARQIQEGTVIAKPVAELAHRFRDFEGRFPNTFHAQSHHDR
jgi:hypothetical protein